MFELTLKEQYIWYLIHKRNWLTKRVRGEEKNIFCEDNDCIDLFNVSVLSSMKDHLCDHLKAVSAETTLFQEKIELGDDCLEEMSEENDKILKRATIESCIELKNHAESEKSPLIVIWERGNYIHSSVLGEHHHYNARLNRYRASYNKNSGDLDCVCNNRKRTCVHKAITLWYLKQNGK